VAAGDNSADLHVTGYNGSIHDLAGNALTAVTGDLGLQIDGTAPAAGALSFVTDSGGTDLNAGHVVAFTLLTSENVYVTGTPDLQLSDGQFATYVSGSGSGALTFDYTVAAGDNTTDLQVAGAHPNGGLVLNGGSILDAAGNALTGSVSTDTHLTIETAAPELTGITASPDSGSVFAGSTVELTLDFNEAVNVTGGTPSLSLNDGGSAVYDAAATALLGDSSKLVFDHLVTANDSAPSLAVDGFLANGATVNDLAGNPATLTNVTAAVDALSINETVVPAYTVGGITRPALELNSAGDIILDQAASTFAATYGMKFLYLGLPASTPYPPVADVSHDFHIT
jgi:hypothetical protein